MVHDVNAAPPACVGLLGREAEAACPCPLHPPEGAVGCGGVGYAVVGAAGRPAGKFRREQLPPARLGHLPAVILGAVHKVAGDPPGAVGLGVPGLGAEGDGPPGEVAGKIRHCHRAVHGSVAVGGGVVEQDKIGEDRVVVAEAPQTHPDSDGVPLAPDAALDAHGHGTAVVYLLPQVLQVHPRLPAGKTAAACCRSGESAVAGAAGGLGFAFLSYLNATLTPGIDLILNAVELEKELEDTDITVTGEGRLDHQTAMGKTPVGVARLAKKYGSKVVALAGSVTPEATACNAAGIDAFFPIVRGITTLAEAMDPEHAKSNMTAAVEQVFRLL